MENKIIEILSEILKMDFNQIQNIDKNDDLRLLGLNSIRGIQMIIMLEEELEIEFSDEDLDFNKFSTINNLLNIINVNLKHSFEN